MGYNIESTNPEEATEEFLKREFKDVLAWKTKPHDATLIPDSFLYGGIAAKVKILSRISTK